MKKYLLTIAAAFVVGIASTNAALVPYFTCDFEKGMPSDITLSDRDCADLHFTMVQLGFGEKDSWITLREEGTENYYGASASRFKTPKGEDPVAAEDWLVTPPVWIRASDAKLTWRGMSVNDRNAHTSTYEVLVSATGASPEDFVAAPVAVINDEPIHEWTLHEVDLGDYVGERIYIAFVNKSTDSDVLAIDDISVEGSNGLAALDIIPGEYTLGDEEIRFGGILTACSDEPVNTLTVTFFVGDDSFHAEYIDLDLHSGEQFEFMLPEKVSASYGDQLSFTVKSEINGIPFDDMNLHTTLLALLPKKRVVVEEATGMWCGYCPQGIVAMETLQEHYPEEFIGVAVHVNDAMEVKGYGNVMPFPAGAPTAWIDRLVYCEDMLMPTYKDGHQTFTTLMGGVESLFLERLSEQAFADVEVNGNYDDSSREMGVDVSVKFAKKYEDSDFRIVLLLTEDNVWKEGYYQTNYQAGLDAVVGGFENLPSRIVEDFEFNHVARWSGEDYTGAEGSLPSELDPGVNYDYSASFTMPKSVLNPNNVKVIAMVADASTGEIMNAAASHINNSGIEIIEKDHITVRVEKGVISAYAEGEVEMTMFSVSGMLVGKVSGNGCAVKDDLASGIYIVKISSGNYVKTMKITV